METTTTSRETYREQLGAGADHCGGARELQRRIAQARHKRDGLSVDIRRLNRELHRATERDRWSGGGSATSGRVLLVDSARDSST